jgi:hypothetical protein
MQRVRRIGFGLFAFFALAGHTGQSPAQAQAQAQAAATGERFEVASIKAVRPTLVDTVAALQQRDAAKAKAAFEAYDSAWNGIEVYVNVRSRDLYQTLEQNFQKKIGDGLSKPNPDTAALLADAQGILAKYDEAIAMVAKGPPLNPLFDDVARLRMVRAHLREVPPALKDGNLAKARKSFEAFDNNWDSIEDLVKARSSDAYVAIEAGMVQIENALMPEKPDTAQVTGLVNDVLAKYNAVVAQITQDARAQR